MRFIKSTSVRFIAVLLFSLFTLASNAGEETRIVSRAGKLSKPIAVGANSLAIQDQWYAFMIQHPIGSIIPYGNTFNVKKAGSRVTLRWDQTAMHYVDYRWKLEVDYSIKRYSSTGVPQTDATETISIDYNPYDGTTYTDKSVNTYFHAAGDPPTPFNSFRSELTITAVRFYSCTGSSSCTYGSATSTIPSALEDVYLDLEQVTDRNYVLDEANPPFMWTQSGYLSIMASSNELALSWEYMSGAEYYELEWVFVDGTAFTCPTCTTLVSLSSMTTAYSFANATRVSIKANHYRIPLAYPRGTIMYRVRGVGYYGNISSTTDQLLYTPWSFTPDATPTVNEGTFGNNRFDYNGLNPAFNWQYQASYSEDGKRKDIINYFDGSLRSRQTITLLNSDNNVVIGETKYDYAGRPMLTMMPTPLTSTGMHYYTGFNKDYDRTKFAKDTKIGNIDILPSSGTGMGKTSQYYSPDNPANTGANAYIPDAADYPFAQTLFMTDGTGRVKSTGGVGQNYQIGSGHETKYLYGTPTQHNLDKLFGNEVGFARHYSRNMVRDANGQVSVSYMDQEGRTIATALTCSTPSNLLPLDGRTEASGDITDYPWQSILNNTTIDNSVVSQHTEIVPCDGDYQFVYSLNSDCYSSDCFSTETVCKDCVYDLEIKITDEYDNLATGIDITSHTCSTTVASNPVVCSGITSGNYQFTIPFIFGSYKIVKTLKLNQASLDDFKSDYIETQNTTHQCVHVPKIIPEPCNDCMASCTEQYIKRNPETGELLKDGSGNTLYFHSDGTSMTSAAAADSITACQKHCVPQNNIQSECMTKYHTLVTDMSPGGQYFDNTPFRYRYDTDGNLISNDLFDGTDWLTANLTSAAITEVKTVNSGLASPIAAITSMSTTSNASNWTIIRDNWQDQFAEVALIKYHPEYYIYKYHCDMEWFEGDGCFINLDMGAFTGAATTGTSNEFDSLMYTKVTDSDANAAHYFDPLGCAGSNTSVGTTTFSDDQQDYIGPTYTSSSSVLDPYFNGVTGCPGNNSCEAIALCGPEGQEPEDYSRQELMCLYLRQFMEIPGSSPKKYYSIWYVLDDPHNLHLPSTSGVNTAIRNVFQTLHGDGTNPGVLGSGSDQMTKYQFFLSVYQYIKQLFIYHTYPVGGYTDNTATTTYPALLTDAGNGFTVANSSTAPSGYGYGSYTFPSYYQIRYQHNAGYDAITDLCPDAADLISMVGPVADDIHEQSCQDVCEQNVDNWLKHISLGCDIYALSAPDMAAMKSNLIDLCVGSCDDDHEDGTSTCAACSTYCAPCSSYVHTFNEVIAGYLTLLPCSTTTVTITYPEAGSGSCSCKLLNDYIEENYGSSLPYNTTTIAADLNAQFGTSYTYANVDAWFSECNIITTASYNLPVTSHPLLSTVHTPNNANLTNLPPELFCSDSETEDSDYNPASCSCDNLTYFINSFNLDPTNSGDKAIIIAHLNDAFNLTGAAAITSTELDDMLIACAGSSPTMTDVAPLPASMLCPQYPASPTDDQKEQTEEAASCMQYNLDEAIDRSAEQYFVYLDLHMNEELDAYVDKCLSSVDSRETFTMRYIEDEYYYTLYYYDQAGNLIKTVPPDGVVFLSETNIDKVKNHRLDPTTEPLAHYPAHTMATDYRYNSLQQKIEQTTPEAGRSSFYYDVLGRLVVSQNKKQTVTSVVSTDNYLHGANTPYNGFEDPSYSYLLYDDLGRVIETGELQNDDPVSYMDTRTTTNLSSWMSISHAHDKRQVTKTYYDEASFSIGVTQKNLRNRVASVTYQEDGTVSPYDNAMHYSYDIHGNVSTYVSENKALPNETYSSYTKQTDYEYDLISGKVNKVTYQKNNLDQFIHRYEYDADNRITRTFTSKDNVIWNTEAKNFYYPHGPLARMEVGNKSVAGTDMAYTLQGWVKGVNSNVLSATRDIGKDGNVSGSNKNSFFGRDAFSYSLGYFAGDYTAINSSGSNHFLAANSGSTFFSNNVDLFNGNISSMITSIEDNLQAQQPVQGRLFQYDQLNRIKTAHTYTDANLLTANTWTTSTVDEGKYKEEFSYDFNGNITTLLRYGSVPTFSPTTLAMDQLTYFYDDSHTSATTPPGEPDKRNVLIGVKDVASEMYSGDIGDQRIGGVDPDATNPATWNYKYDMIGNMETDVAEEIDDIEWNTNGKIKEIKRVNTSAKPDLEFIYDAMGNRIVKIEITKTSGLGGYVRTTSDNWKYTYYSRDAQGNVLSVYEKLGDNFNQVEKDLFGSTRLGLYGEVVNMVPGGEVDPSAIVLCRRDVGQRFYEQANHLGNVLSVIADNKLAYENAGAPDGIIDYYYADVRSATDYYSFGSPMPDRNFNSSDYRYGFNGKENDPETVGTGEGTQDYGMRIYNPGLGRFLSVDPLEPQYPWYTPYQFAGNQPIRCIDMDGEEPESAPEDWKNTPGTKDYGDFYGHGSTLLRVYDNRTLEYYWVEQYTRCSGSSFSWYNYSEKRWEEFVPTGYTRNFVQEPFKERDLGSKHLIEMADFLERAVVVTGVVVLAAPLVVETVPIVAAATIEYAPVVFNAIRPYVMAKLEFNIGSGVSDFISQSITTKFDYSKYNITSTVSATIIGNPFYSAGVGSGLQYSVGEGYTGLGSGKKSFDIFVGQTAIGTVGNILGDQASEGFKWLYMAGKKPGIRLLEEQFINLGGNLMGDLPSGVASDDDNGILDKKKEEKK